MPYTIVPERRGLGLQSSGGVERGDGGVSGAAAAALVALLSTVTGALCTGRKSSSDTK